MSKSLDAVALGHISKIQHIVCHKNPASPCPDGVASALILLDAMRSFNVDPRVTFVAHNTPEHDELRAESGMIFCDITPSPKRAAEFVAKGAIVLDHHKTTKNVVEMFGAHGVFGDEEKDPGVSGAVLAFREVWAPIYEPTVSDVVFDFASYFAKLAGVRDTWQRNDPAWLAACHQAEALRFWPWSALAAHHDPFGRGPSASVSNFGEKMGIGVILCERNFERDTMLIKNGRAIDIIDPPLRAYIVPGVETSDIADRLEAEDLVIGFALRHTQSRTFLQLSTRSRSPDPNTSTFDCAAFCKAHGGGGHTRAAGCTIQLTNADPHPFVFIEKLLRDYVRGLP